MRKSLFALVALALFLTGCASTDYKLYTETQVKIAQAQAQAEAMKETARYAALAEIAKTGDSAARVAAVMSINFGAGNAAPASRSVVLNPPRSTSDTLLQWTGVLLPAVTNLYGISANRQIAVTQSNNQAAVAASTNAAFANIASAGFSAVTTTAGQIKPNITISGNSGTSVNAGNDGTSTAGSVTWQPLSGSGVIGTGSYSLDASNRPTTTSTSTSSFTTSGVQ